MLEYLIAGAAAVEKLASDWGSDLEIFVIASRPQNYDMVRKISHLPHNSNAIVCVKASTKHSCVTDSTAQFTRSTTGGPTCGEVSMAI